MVCIIDFNPLKNLKGVLDNECIKRCQKNSSFPCECLPGQI